MLSLTKHRSMSGKNCSCSGLIRALRLAQGERAISLWLFPILSTCKSTYFVPVGPHHCFLFPSAPTFDLSFGCESFLTAGTFLRKDKFYWAAARGVITTDPADMLVETFLKVISVTSVVGPVCVAQNIDPERHQRNSYACLCASTIRHAHGSARTGASARVLISKGSFNAPDHFHVRNSCFHEFVADPFEAMGLIELFHIRLRMHVYAIQPLLRCL